MLAKLKSKIRIKVAGWLFKGFPHEIELNDGTKVVRMSADFHDWVYSEGHELWQAYARRNQPKGRPLSN